MILICLHVVIVCLVIQDPQLWRRSFSGIAHQVLPLAPCRHPPPHLITTTLQTRIQRQVKKKEIKTHHVVCVWLFPLFISVCPHQIPLQTVTVWAVRPAGKKRCGQTDAPWLMSVSQNSLLPTQTKDGITRVYYWQWRGGSVSLAGPTDHTPSLYRTRSEGILQTLHLSSSHMFVSHVNRSVHPVVASLSRQNRDKNSGGSFR